MNLHKTSAKLLNITARNGKAGSMMPKLIAGEKREDQTTISVTKI